MTCDRQLDSCIACNVCTTSPFEACAPGAGAGCDVIFGKAGLEGSPAGLREDDSLAEGAGRPCSSCMAGEGSCSGACSRSGTVPLALQLLHGVRAISLVGINNALMCISSAPNQVARAHQQMLRRILGA